MMDISGRQEAVNLGLIDYNGGIEVHSSLLNVILHDQAQLKI
jgi:hypothetical protein